MRIDHGDAIVLEGIVRNVFRVNVLVWVGILMPTILNQNHLMLL